MEAATIILSVSVLIDETKGEGPPRYYAIGSGSEAVRVKSIYMTKLDRVTCSADYELVENQYSNLNYQSCDVPCHSECFGGCNARNSSQSCLACDNDKLYTSASRFNCIPTCNEQYPDEGMPITQVMISGVLTDITTGDISNSAELDTNGDPTIVKAFIPIEGTCRLCHKECGFGCKGTGNRNCISANIATDPYNLGCKNVQVYNNTTQTQECQLLIICI